MTTILGLDTDPQGVVRRAHELGLKAATARWITHGSIRAVDVDEWVGVEPVEGEIMLAAPDPKPSDRPGQWIALRGGWHANTSGVILLRADSRP